MTDSVPAPVEPAVESPLVDLGAVPLSVLRQLGGALIERSMRYVVTEAGFVRVSADQGGAERVD